MRKTMVEYAEKFNTDKVQKAGENVAKSFENFATGLQKNLQVKEPETMEENTEEQKYNLSVYVEPCSSSDAADIILMMSNLGYPYELYLTKIVPEEPSGEDD